jgi:hypothetical protein
MEASEFEGWRIYDMVEPLGHSDRMLGLIAFMLSCYLGIDDKEEMRKICMPWDSETEADPASILKGNAKWRTSEAL